MDRRALRPLLQVAAAVLVLGFPAAPAAEILEVGQGKPFARIEDALEKARPGDTIRVLPLPGGRPYERPALLVRTPRLTFAAARAEGGKRVRIDGTGFEYSGAGRVPRAIFQFDPGADGCVIEGFELFGARNDSSNGAGVRINQASDVTVRDCEIHGCDMGIMSNGEVSRNTARNQLIDGCEIHENGSEAHAGYNHNLYLGGTSVVLRGSNVWGSTTGHNVKSRAHLNWIEACYVHDSANREFDLVDDAENTTEPESHSVIIGCIVAKASEAKGNRAVIHFGQDGGKDHRGTLYLVNDTIITPYIAPVVELSAPGAKAALLGCVVWDGGVAQSGQVAAAARNGASLEHVSGKGSWFSRNFALPPAMAGTSIVAAGPDDLPFAGAWGGDVRLLAAPGPKLVDAGVAVSDLGLPAHPAAKDPKAPVRLLEYRHPCGAQPRRTAGKPDLGAFEAAKP